MPNQILVGSSTSFPAYLLPQPSIRPSLICPGGRELTITLPGVDKQKMPIWADSEVARFRERQQLEEEAVQRVFFSPAALAKHNAINKRMRQGAETLVELFEQGRDEEAYALWDAGILGGGQG